MLRQPIKNEIIRNFNNSVANIRAGYSFALICSDRCDRRAFTLARLSHRLYPKTPLNFRRKTAHTIPTQIYTVHLLILPLPTRPVQSYILGTSQ